MESLLTEPIKPAARKFSVDEYYRMAKVGILRQKERVEFLDGQILCMAPVGDSHQDLVDTLSKILGDQRCQSHGPVIHAGTPRQSVEAGGRVGVFRSKDFFPGSPG